MRKLSYLIFIFSLFTLVGCAKATLVNSPATPNVTPPTDSFIYGYAYLDANYNGQIDESDSPLVDAQFTATDANGLSASAKTDANGQAVANYPSESGFPVTLRMSPPPGYTAVGSDEVVIVQSESNAKFLFQENPTPIPELTPEIIDISARTQYTLTAVLDYASHHLAVDEQISFTNRYTEALQEIPLIVEPQRYYGVFKLKGITLQDGSTITPVEDVNWLTLPLAQPLKPRQNLHLSISYELNLPFPQPSALVRPVPFGYTERQTNLVDWYPFIPPYVPGKGWLKYKPGYFGEHLSYEYADFQVSLMVSDVPASSFVNPDSAGDQPVIGYAIAASAPAELDVDWRHYRLESARNFVWSISHSYQVFSKQVGDVTVLSYSFPVHSLAGKTTLDEALCTYAEHLYYEKYSQEGLKWWWTYRINYYKPQGYIDGSILGYNYASNAYETYRNAVYLNGAVFLDELRHLIGDEAFFAFLKDYVVQNQGKISTATTFFDILSQHTQVDISDLVKKYFRDR